MKGRKFPKIGQRIIKSAVGVFVCYLIFILRRGSGIPFYSMLAALQCIQPYTEKTHQMALQRASGTITGAAFGLVAILLEIYVFGIYDSFAGYFFNALMIIPVIYTTILLHRKDISYFSCVVYLSIAVNHIADTNPFIFVLNRVLDTFIGIAVGIIVNSAKLPRKKVTDCLFVASLDDMISPLRGKISPYSEVEINRMIEDGMNLTFSTMRTPASIINPLGSINVKFPAVVMDGAALYDMNENTYLKAYVISHSSSRELVTLIRSEGMNCFINALCDDNLIIYYDKLENEAEKELFRTLRRSPFRNYVCREPNENNRTIYIMAIDRTEKIENLYKKLEVLGYADHFRVIRYGSDEYEGFSYIKIYNRNASAENMIRYLMESQNLSESRTIRADSESGAELDVIVKNLKKNFEPTIFS